ncbi:DUF2169 family type VI secretion system accessory protein [Paracoccus onubensis]|uniref:DUF2169 domain-containing protein n=1 Tax=Paracoccus onubensis TaxID=1675788 RepID=A0A418T4T4_9RHOB|nr:DUF2169 domain-containing protein [Paracoccus onubensis]RJE88241.1 DUF2169 domain-containing protein [Paracoccus onubensis]
MRIRNLTPFAQLVFANEDAEGRLFDILIVKQSYHLNREFELQQSPEQEPLNFTDRCFGDINETSLRYPSDLVAYKPATDVIVIADAFAPKGEPATQWQVSVQIGPVRKSLHVTGPREWQRKLRKWNLTDPEPVLRVALRYECTYGGEYPGPDDRIVTDERNPLGSGFVHPEYRSRDEPIPAPQILTSGERLDNPFRRLDPAGIGPIPPAWLPRRPLGGTYDDEWLANTWPHWAKDYDFAFHNSAAEGLKSKGFLQGDEPVHLTGLHPERHQINFDLPGNPIIARLIDHEDWCRSVRLNLDTIYIDILDAEPEDCLISLTWRLTFLEEQVKWLEIDCAATPNRLCEMTEDQQLHPAPHPSELFPDHSPKEVSEHVQ